MKFPFYTHEIKISLKSFVIIAVILCMFGMIIVRGREYYYIKTDDNDTKTDYEYVDFDQCIVSTSGYEVNDNEYGPTNEDPQVLVEFENDSNGIYAFRLELSKKIDLSKVQVFFGENKAEFSELSSKVFEPEENNVIEVVSNSRFKYARIDINEVFEVESLQVMSELEYIKVYNATNYVISVGISILLAFILSLNAKFKVFMEKLCRKLCDFVKSMWENKKLVLCYMVALVLIFMFSVACEHVLSWYKERDYINKSRLMIIYAVFLILAITWWFRKNIIKYSHIYFLLIVMIIGTINIYISPRTCGVSWDDEIHYGKTEYLSWIGSDKISVSSDKIINEYSRFALSKNGYSLQGRTNWESELDDTNDGKTVLVETDKYEISWHYIAYIPAALGLILGRGMGLSIIHTFMFGKWINLLCYGIALSVSMKWLKTRGKMIIMAIGLIPTSVFMATNYSYDWWLICLTILGYSVLISDIQKGKKLTNKKMLLVLLIMVIAILPKAVYFPLIFPMLLLSKDKYENAKLCRASALMGMFFLLGTFVLPMLMGTGTSGDVRGGSGVDSIGQMKFILTQPIEYAKILLNFLESYLSLDNSKGYLTFMAYYGNASNYVICLVMLILSAFVDNDASDIKEEKNIIYKVGVGLSVIGSIVLVATALYISFTPLMHLTINGCQYRYILPIIFVTLYSFFSVRVTIPNKIKCNTMMITSIVMSFVFLGGIYNLCAIYY